MPSSLTPNPSPRGEGNFGGPGGTNQKELRITNDAQLLVLVELVGVFRVGTAVWVGATCQQLKLMNLDNLHLRSEISFLFHIFVNFFNFFNFVNFPNFVNFYNFNFTVVRCMSAGCWPSR